MYKILSVLILTGAFFNAHAETPFHEFSNSDVKHCKTYYSRSALESKYERGVSERFVQYEGMRPYIMHDFNKTSQFIIGFSEKRLSRNQTNERVLNSKDFLKEVDSKFIRIEIDKNSMQDESVGYFYRAKSFSARIVNMSNTPEYEGVENINVKLVSGMSPEQELFLEFRDSNNLVVTKIDCEDYFL